jgi:GH35 family endo-1,4-beta-xylanase
MPGRRTFALVISIAALAAPPGASAQSGPDFPIYGEDKWLGNVNTFTQPQFLQYFNQVTPENAGKWQSAAGTTRTAAMRWTQLDQAYNFARTNDFPYNFHTLLWGNQQPTWMWSLPPAEQLDEIKKWFSAVALRYPDMDWVQVVNEGTWDPPDCSHQKNPTQNECNTAGNYVRALGGYNDTDGTGQDWILNAFRLARQYFPEDKLMLNDVLITNSPEATTEYVRIIELLKRENLIDAVGVQGHAHVFKEGVPNAPTIPGRPWKAEEDMRVHKANLDRIAATGIPIQVTELDLDGVAAGGVPGDEVQLADYRRVFPTLWTHPGVEGITLWGWRQPNHWRNASNAPIILSNGTLKPAAHWLFNYVRGIAPVIRPDQSFSLNDANAAVGSVQADDWASQIGRPHLRTFTWRITEGSDAFAIEPATGALGIADQRLLDEHTTYPLKVRVSDGYHESAEVGVTVATGNLANVVDTDVGATVPATLSLSLAGSATFNPFTPGVASDYEASVGATVTSTAGDATLSVADPAGTGRLVNGAFSLVQPVQAAVSGAFAAVGGSPLTLHSYGGPVSNDPLTIRVKQTIGASQALRTGAYGKTFTFTLSTTAP